MDFYEYLQHRADACRGNGVEYMAEMLEKIILDQGTVKDLESALTDSKRKELEAESFSMEHTYYWSMSGHLEDVIKHWKILDTLQSVC